MIFPGLASDYVGIPLAVVLLAWNYFTSSKKEEAEPKSLMKVASRKW